jgi:hypothetical protein
MNDPGSRCAPQPIARSGTGSTTVRVGDALTEVLWATLHGLITLDRGGRLRPQLDDERIELLAAQFRLAT